MTQIALVLATAKDQSEGSGCVGTAVLVASL